MERSFRQLTQEGKKYKSHGKVIDFKEVHDILELNVQRIDPKGGLWNDLWELYCRSIAFLQQHQRQGAAKLFESEIVSLMLHLQPITAQRQPPQQPRIRSAPPTPQRPTPRQPQPSLEPPKTPAPPPKKSSS